MAAVRIGLELEFIVPVGRSRRDLAKALARSIGGRVREVPQVAEFMLGPPDERPPKTYVAMFRAFEVVDSSGVPRFGVHQEPAVTCDPTDARQYFEGPERWSSLVLVAPALADTFTSAKAGRWSADQTLARGARRLGWTLYRPEDGLAYQQHYHRLRAVLPATGALLDPVVAIDQGGAPAAAAGLEAPGRERVAEVVCAPVPASKAGAVVRAIYDAAVDTGSRIGAESGTHIHFDGPPFESPAALARVLNVLDGHREAIWAMLGWEGTKNTQPIEPPILYLANRSALDGGGWEGLVDRLTQFGVTKFRDINVANIVNRNRRKPTFELRILPVDADVDRMVQRVELAIAIVMGALSRKRPVRHPSRLEAERGSSAAMLRALGVSTRRFSALLELLPSRRRRPPAGRWQPVSADPKSARRRHAATRLARALGVDSVIETRLSRGRLEQRVPALSDAPPPAVMGLELVVLGRLWGTELRPGFEVRVAADDQLVVLPPANVLLAGRGPLGDGRAAPMPVEVLRRLRELDPRALDDALGPAERRALRRRLQAVRADIDLRARTLGVETVVQPVNALLL